MWFVRGLIILTGVVALLWLGMQNAGHKVDFNFFTKDFGALNLNLFMLLVFITGMVFSFLIAAVNEFQLRRQIGRYRREVQQLERELSALRNLPLEDAETVSDDVEFAPGGHLGS